MNDNQKEVLVFTGIILLLMLIFPPFHAQFSGGVSFGRGYGFILNPPRGGARIDVGILLIQWFFVASIGGLAYKYFKD
ncbi:hypothetical protein ACSTAY_06665 [Vreelandella alkaliphila]